MQTQESSNSENEMATPAHFSRSPLEIEEVVVETFHDNLPLPFNIKPCSSRHRHHTSSCLFLIFMTISSAIAFIFQMYFLHLIFDLTMRMYFCFPIIFFMFIEKTFVILVAKRFNNIWSRQRRSEYKVIQQEQDQEIRVRNQHQQQKQERSPFSIFYHDKSIHWCNVLKVICEVLTSCFLCFCYLFIVPKVTTLMDDFFQDIDGDISSDWYREDEDLVHLSKISKCIGFLYVLVISFAVFAVCTVAKEEQPHYQRCDQSESTLESTLTAVDGRNETSNNNLGLPLNLVTILRSCQISATFFFSASILLLWISVFSILTYLIDHKIPIDNNIGPHCDPIDTTECLLPFPSSFFTVEDETTLTGSRINIEIDAMRKLFKGRNNPKNPTNLNDLDGFQTSGPILFYLAGLKEGHGKGTTRLIGPEEMHLSVTNQSLTLLVDIDSMNLIPHFSEIDYLDENKPLVILQPSKVLEHNRHYAVAVIDATDSFGKKLPVSSYLELLLTLNEDLSTRERKRGELYSSKVMPSLKKAAPFLQSEQRIQLLFDFHTMSVDCQLGNTKKIIQGTLNQFEKKEWNGWNESNARSIKVIDNDCANNEESTGRIVHGSIDLPHFLKDANTRIGELDDDAIQEGMPNGLFTVKFVVSVPCSLKQGSKSVRAVVDYGHSFLYSRNEVLRWKYMQRMADAKGYLMIGINWRGMSMFDFPVIIKAFAGDPNILSNIRDNIIQGYAFKAGVTHFARHGLLDMEFMKFGTKLLKQGQHSPPRIVFHGISQGAILGSAYSTLLGPSKLLDGSAVISPATPFSLIMSRSTIFPSYEKLMLLNLRHKRHVRIFISMMQMYYDSIEAGGILATTAEEDRTKTLLIAGIGDPTVTTIGTEILARNYDASIFRNNPHPVYGLSTLSTNNDNHSVKEVKCLLNEILYEDEEGSLPPNNVAGSFNGVHLCVHSDKDVVTQLTEFIDTGNFVDVCPDEGCVRKSTWDRLNAGDCY